MNVDEYLDFFGIKETVLEHHGVKGMHWGVRESRTEKGSSTPDRHAAKTEIKRSGVLDQAKKHADISTEHALIAEKFARHHDEVNEKGFQSEAAKRVFGNNAAQQSNRDFYRQNRVPKGMALDQVKNQLRQFNNYHGKLANKHAKIANNLYAKAEKLQHEEAGSLAHHGVKGQKWGEHHARRMARADANEFAKARAYYGEGAGTRRKLIKAKVETRSQNSHYKKEFHRVLSGQNIEKRSAQATRKRRRADTTNFVGKTTRGVHRSLTGGFGPVTATAATIAAGAAYAHKSGLDKVVLNKAKSAATNHKAQEAARAFLKSQGIG
jgi:hypothetical protein